MASPRRKMEPDLIAMIIRCSVMIWSAGLLTASYMNLIKNPDEAFIASVFTAALSTFGIEKPANKAASSLGPKKPISSNKNAANGGNNST